MRNFGQLAFINIVLALIVCPIGGAAAQTTEKPKIQGCPLPVAVQRVDDFVEKKIVELSSQSAEMLKKMQTIMIKAKRPGVALKDQLSAIDISQFQEARHENILLGAEKAEFGALRRDTHLLSSLYEAAQFADLYELKRDSLGADSPIRFYLSIIEALRSAQPRVSPTPMIGMGIECDPEAGLFWEETFYQNQLAQNGADQHLVNIIFDLERLRTLYQLDWNLFNKGFADIQGVKWNDDTPISSNTMGIWLSTSSLAIQSINKSIIPYIDRNLPSDTQIEATYMQGVVQNAASDYPLKRKK